MNIYVYDILEMAILWLMAGLWPHTFTIQNSNNCEYQLFFIMLICIPLLFIYYIPINPCIYILNNDLSINIRVLE